MMDGRAIWRGGHRILWRVCIVGPTRVHTSYRGSMSFWLTRQIDRTSHDARGSQLFAYGLVVVIGQGGWPQLPDQGLAYYKVWQYVCICIYNRYIHIHT